MFSETRSRGSRQIEQIVGVTDLDTKTPNLSSSRKKAETENRPQHERALFGSKLVASRCVTPFVTNLPSRTRRLCRSHPQSPRSSSIPYMSDPNTHRARSPNRPKANSRLKLRVVRALTVLQHSSASVLGVFVVVHLAAPAAALVGGSSASNSVMVRATFSPNLERCAYDCLTNGCYPYMCI